MPKITGTTGSGMTERGVVEFDWETPGDADAQVLAAIEAFDRSSFARLSKRLKDLTTAILVQASLPCDPERAYVVRPDGTWQLLDEAVNLEAEQGSDLLPLDQAVRRLGCEPDSPEGYAARVLRTLSLARHELRAGNLDDAMAHAFAAGELVNEAAMKGVFEKDYLAGAGARVRMRKIHEKEYGTAEEIEARDEAIRRAVGAGLAQGFAKMKVYKAAAAHFRTSVSTVRRALGQNTNKG